MKMMIIQPPHSFVPSELPPVPGAGRSFPVLRCQHCGILGYSADNKTITLMNANQQKHKAMHCCGDHKPPTSWYALITCPHLHKRGPAFDRLRPGTTHLIRPIPEFNHSTRVPGIWVYGTRDEPVKLLEGEFLPIAAQSRRRRLTVATDVPMEPVVPQEWL